MSKGLSCGIALVLVLSLSIRGQGAHPREIIIVPNPASENMAPEIQTAVNTLAASGGGVIRLAAGIFNIGNANWAVTLENVANILLKGDGDATVLRQAPGTSAANFFRILNSNNITFQAVRFEGLPISNFEGDTHYNAAIQADGVNTGIRILNCHFLNFKTGGANLRGSLSNSEITNCTFDNVSNKYDPPSADNGAIHLSDAASITVSGCRFFNLKFSAISVDRAVKSTFAQNIAHFDPASPNTMGIYVLEGIQKCIISANQFYGPFNEGLDLRTKPTGLPIEGNVITGNQIEARYVGIALNGGALCGAGYVTASHNTIANNVISGFNQGGIIDIVDHGIYIQRSEFTQISGNEVYNARYGINSQQCTGSTTVTNNQIYNCSHIGISLNGTGGASNNLVNAATTGMSIGHSSYSSVIGNVFLNCGKRLVKDPTVTKSTILYNCDQTGTCN